MSDQENTQEIVTSHFGPVKIVEVELSQPLPHIVLNVGQGAYQRAMIIARLHTHPIGLLQINFINGEITPSQLAEHIWAQFGKEINEHLQQDGLTQQADLHVNGLVYEVQPGCLIQREELLKNGPLVSIVVSTRDRVQSLENTLNSLMALEYPKFEIILVDNAPQTNETHEYYNFIHPRFLRNNISLRYIREDTPGLAVAHNKGLELVRGSIVAFTDDDVIVDKHWLLELVQGFNFAPHVGCVTGLVVPLELQTAAQVLFEEFGGFVKGFRQQIYDFESYRPKNPLFPYTAGHFGTGANMAFRTDFLIEVNGFDPALGIGTPSLGADDMAAFFQTIIHGYQLVYRPSAVIYHQHRRTYESLCKQMFGYGTGLTAFIAKCMIDNPELIIDILSKVPSGIKYAFSRSSPKNLHKSSNYPPELEWIERKGMLYGPIAYLLSRWRYRKFREQFSASRSRLDPIPSQHILVTEWVKDQQGNESAKKL